MKGLYKKASFIATTFCLVMAILLYSILFRPSSPRGLWKEVVIPKGATYREVVKILKKEGIINLEFPLLFLGRITMSDRRVMAGYYNLNTEMSIWDVFRCLREGRIIQYVVTIPPGSTLSDIKRRLETFGLVDDTSWGIVYDRRFLESLKIDAPSLEGYIYPDTYNLPKGISARDIFSIMVQRMRERFDESLRKRAEEIGMVERDVLTLASIIEKEARYDSERPLISAVYHNRLRRGIKLQADPTVLYRREDGNKQIRYTDLKRQDPYNTYYIPGLPPGPIASPSIASINAALYPADVDYLFFVSRNDGTHHFSLTGEEHLEAVKFYQRDTTGKNDNKKTYKTD